MIYNEYASMRTLRHIHLLKFSFRLLQRQQIAGVAIIYKMIVIPLVSVDEVRTEF